MGTNTSLSNNIWMDIARSHVVLVAGKRGSGKSYTLGVLAEELANLPDEASKNVASLMFDTMGIFWTMKYPNEKEKRLLEQWNIPLKVLPLNVFVPFGKAEEYKTKKIPFDRTFALLPSELQAEDWIDLFTLKFTEPAGVLIARSIANLRESKEVFTIKDIIESIKSDQNASQITKEVAQALFSAADSWGIFSKTLEGTAVEDLVTSGTTTVLDISVYSSIGAFNIRAMVIGLLSRKLFESRMASRKREELESLRQGANYLSYKKERHEPLIWIFIDEAHEFLPREGKTPATDALVQLLREGRQPGISMVLATQQPGQIHRDVMTQSDIVFAHRVTSKADIEALNEIMQTYLLASIRQQIDDLPALKGSAIILDDNSERIYPLRMRPRMTWHGGESPVAIRAEMEL